MSGKTYVSVTGWLALKKGDEWAAEVLNFIQANQILERYLLPNKKYNDGVTFLWVKSRPSSIPSADDDDYSSKMYQFLCRCIIPVVILSDKPLAVPCVFKDNEDGVQFAGGKLVGKPTQSAKNKNEPITLAIWEVDSQPVDSSGPFTKPSEMPKQVLGGGRGEKDAVLKITADLLEQFKTNYVAYCSDTSEKCRFVDPFLPIMNTILDKMEKEKPDLHHKVCLLLDLCPMISYFIVVQPCVSDFNNTILADFDFTPGLLENAKKLSDLGLNSNVATYLKHFKYDHELTKSHNKQVNIRSVNLLLKGGLTFQNLKDEYKTWVSSHSGKFCCDANLKLKQDLLRFLMSTQYMKLFLGHKSVCKDKFADNFRYLIAVTNKITFNEGEKMYGEDDSQLSSETGVIKNFINSSDFCYVSPILKEDSNIYVLVWDSKDEDSGYFNSNSGKLQYLLGLMCNTVITEEFKQELLSYLQ